MKEIKLNLSMFNKSNAPNSLLVGNRINPHQKEYKPMRLKILLCATLVLILVAGYGHAKIDPDRIVGIWLLNEGNGDVAEDASGNGRKGTITQGNWSAVIMDDVGIFNDGLTEDEVQGIMNDGIYHTAYAVEPLDKLSVLWGKLKME